MKLREAVLGQRLFQGIQEFRVFRNFGSDNVLGSMLIIEVSICLKLQPKS